MAQALDFSLNYKYLILFVFFLIILLVLIIVSIIKFLKYIKTKNKKDLIFALILGIIVVIFAFLLVVFLFFPDLLFSTSNRSNLYLEDGNIAALLPP
jgi:cytochrome bd-type quinol oxidase subunit 2